ncbi:hypothetical protein D9M68_851590 [compost metagenome]
MAGLTEQCFFLGQGLDDLFHEKGIALGFLQYKLLKGPKSELITQQNAEHALCLDRTQGFKPQFGVLVRMTPGELKLGPIIYKDEDPSVVHPLDKEGQERCGLAIQPLQIFEQNLNWLILALAHQQARDGLESALAPKACTHVPQRRAEFSDAQQVQQVREDVFQAALQG